MMQRDLAQARRHLRRQVEQRLDLVRAVVSLHDGLADHEHRHELGARQQRHRDDALHQLELARHTWIVEVLPAGWTATSRSVDDASSRTVKSASRCASSSPPRRTVIIRGAASLNAAIIDATLRPPAPGSITAMSTSRKRTSRSASVSVATAKT